MDEATAAFALIMIADQPDKARPHLRRAIELIADDAGHRQASSAWPRLYASSAAWLSGDVEASLEELDHWAGDRKGSTGPEPSLLDRYLWHGYRALGLVERAREIHERSGGDDRLFAATEAFHRGDHSRVGELLPGAWPAFDDAFSFKLHSKRLAIDSTTTRSPLYLGQEWLRAPKIRALARQVVRTKLLVQSGFHDEAAEVLRHIEGLLARFAGGLPIEWPAVRVARAQIAHGEARQQDVVNLLQGLDVNALAFPAGAGPVLAFETSSFYFVGVDTLASALERLDRRREALEVLEEASRLQRWSYPYSQELWMEVELHRARLYRQLGRVGDARRVEDRLQDLMKLADADFWLAEELERIGS